MKKTLLSVFLFLFSTVFADMSQAANKPFVILSSESNPMKSETVRIERRFITGQKIYWYLIAPKKFKYPVIRVRLTKHEEKTSNWGYKILQTRDIYIDENAKSYKDYFVINMKGQYLIEFFYVNNKDYPFARTEFIVD